MFHRWSVAGKGRYRACTYNVPPVVGGAYNVPPVVGGGRGRAVVGGLRGRVAGLEILGVEKICGFGAILRVVSGLENLGGVGIPGWARNAPFYTHCAILAPTTEGHARKDLKRPTPRIIFWSSERVR